MFCKYRLMRVSNGEKCFVIVFFSKQHNFWALILKVLNLTLTIVFLSDTIKRRYPIVNMLQSKRSVFLWTSNTLILGGFTILQNHCFVWSTFFFHSLTFLSETFFSLQLYMLILMIMVVISHYPISEPMGYLGTLWYFICISYMYLVFLCFFVHVDFFGVTDIK